MWSPNILNWMESKYGDLRSATATSNLPIWQIPLGTSAASMVATLLSGLEGTHFLLGAILSIADLQLFSLIPPVFVNAGPNPAFLNMPDSVLVISSLFLRKTRRSIRRSFHMTSCPLLPAANLLAKSSDKLG